jgi:signal peptidase II
VHDVQAARGASLSDGSDARPGHRVVLLVAVAAAVLAVDVVTKLVAVDRLETGHPVEVVDGVLTMRLVRNPGAAFGFAQGMTILFSVVAVIVAVFILRIASRLRSTAWAVALGLVLGGALGNLADRVFREPAPLRGHVIDFIELPHWPVFNLADSCIVAGGVLMVLLSVLGVTHDNSAERGAREKRPGPDAR